MLARLGLGGTFREAVSESALSESALSESALSESVSPMDTDVGDDLALGWGRIDLRLLYTDGRVSLRLGPAHL